MKKISLLTILIALVFIGTNCKKDSLKESSNLIIGPELSVNGPYIKVFVNGTDSAWCSAISINCLDEIVVVAGQAYTNFTHLIGEPGSEVGDYFSGDQWKVAFPSLDYDEHSGVIIDLASGDYVVLLTNSNGIKYYQFIDANDLGADPICVMPVYE